MSAPSVDPPRTALVIDDEETLCRLIARILERSGYAVRTAADGASGLERFRAHPGKVDLVLLDVVMPGPGPEVLLPALRASAGDPAVILMSGAALPDALADEVEQPRRWFLRKPFVPRTLERLLDEVAAAPRSKGANASNASNGPNASSGPDASSGETGDGEASSAPDGVR